MFLNTEVLKLHVEEIKEYIDSFDKNVAEDKFIINELWKTVGTIRDKIWREEMDERNKERLNCEVVDGQEVVIPYFMNGLGEDKFFKIIDGDLYALPKQFKRKEDGSFHTWAYVYIKTDENKHIRLVVRMLGGDTYGNRIFTESIYFKKPESFQHYYSKDYGKDNRVPVAFKEHAHNIIKEFNKLDGVENFNPLEKKKK